MKPLTKSFIQSVVLKVDRFFMVSRCGLNSIRKSKPIDVKWVISGPGLRAAGSGNRAQCDPVSGVELWLVFAVIP